MAQLLGDQLNEPPSDGITSMHYSGHSPFLLVSSWDTVRARPCASLCTSPRSRLHAAPGCAYRQAHPQTDSEARNTQAVQQQAVPSAFRRRLFHPLSLATAPGAWGLPWNGACPEPWRAVRGAAGRQAGAIEHGALSVRVRVSYLQTLRLYNTQDNAHALTNKQRSPVLCSAYPDHNTAYCGLLTGEVRR